MPRTTREALRLEGEQLRQARSDAGFTQVRLAKALGVTQQEVSHWETGRRAIPLRVKGRIAQTLHVKAEYIWIWKR